MTPIIITDGGRTDALMYDENDCTVRAYAVAMNKPYPIAHAIFEDFGRERKRGLEWSYLMNVFASLGIAYRYGERRGLMSFIRTHKKGTFILALLRKGIGHAVCLRDGVLYDETDIRKARWKVLSYSEVC